MPVNVSFSSGPRSVRPAMMNRYQRSDQAILDGRGAILVLEEAIEHTHCGDSGRLDFTAKHSPEGLRSG